MTKGDLVAAIADKAGLDRKQAGAALDATLEVITTTLQAGEEVKIVGFGNFGVSTRAGGEGRNPKTGEKIAIRETKSPRFKAGAGLKSALNGAKDEGAEAKPAPKKAAKA